MVSCTTTVITHSSLTAFQAPAVSLNARQMPGRWPSATDPVLGVTDVMTLAVMVTGTAAGSGERPPCGPRPLPAVTPMSDAAPRRQGAAAVRRSDRRRSGRPPRHNNQSCVALPLVFSVPIPTQIGGSRAMTSASDRNAMRRPLRRVSDLNADSARRVSLVNRASWPVQTVRFWN